MERPRAGGRQKGDHNRSQLEWASISATDPNETGVSGLRLAKARGKGHLRVLSTVQRAALLRIISAFRTVATQALEVECHVLPTHLRLKRRGQDVLARLFTLPKEHPLAQVVNRVKSRTTRKGTQPRFALAETPKTMNIAELESLETIERSPLEPWG